jgi:hypothetical protein
MEQVEIFVNEDGDVVIKQPCFGTDDSVIILAPAQVDTVCEWLMQSKKEAQEGGNQ